MAQEDVPIQLWQEIINNVLQEPAAIVLLFAVTAYWIFTSIRAFQAEGIRSIPTSLFNLSIFVILPGAFIALTEGLALRAPQVENTANPSVDELRWIVLYAVLLPLILLFTYRFGRFQTVIVALTHLSIIHLGWAIGKWGGIFLVSTPIIVIFYYFLYFLSQVTFPASNPEDPTERRNKFVYSIWSVWGLQYPAWVAKSSATRESEMRISGNFIKPFGIPGIMWMHSHQAIVRSNGMQLVGVDGPGKAKCEFQEISSSPLAYLESCGCILIKQL